MYGESEPISILTETECWSLLSSVALGRLVTSVDGHPEIFPVNFVVQHKTVLFRTAALKRARRKSTMHRRGPVQLFSSARPDKRFRLFGVATRVRSIGD